MAKLTRQNIIPYIISAVLGIPVGYTFELSTYQVLIGALVVVGVFLGGKIVYYQIQGMKNNTQQGKNTDNE